MGLQLVLRRPHHFLTTVLASDYDGLAFAHVLDSQRERFRGSKGCDGKEELAMPRGDKLKYTEKVRSASAKKAAATRERHEH